MRCTGILLLILLLPSILPAVEEDPPLLMHLEKAPAPGSSTTIITRTEIDRSHYAFVLDLLRSVTGLQVLQAGSAGKPGFVLSRGSEFEEVLMLIDGTPINATLLPVDFAHLTTTNVERIEITRGPQSGIYGSSAMGAVVNIITRYSGPFLSGLGEYGSDNTARAGIRSGAGSNANHYSVAYEHFETDGQQDNDDYRNDTISARAKVMITPWTAVALHYHDINTENGVDPSSVAFLRRDTRQRLLSLPISQQIAKWLTTEFRFSTWKQEFDLDSSRTETYRIGGRMRYTEMHELFAGYEHEQSQTTTRLFTDQEITNDAVFVEYRLNASQLSGVLALRNDDDDISGSHFSPFGSVAYRFNSRFQVLGSAGSSFRRPVSFEVLSFVKQKATGFSAGVQITAARSSQFTATAFHNNYEFFPIPEDIIDRIISYDASGIELEGSTHVLPQLLLRGNFTYSNAENDLDSPNSGFLGLGYTHKDFQADMNWFYTGSTGGDDDFHRVDLIASYNLPRGFQVYGRILNLFDTTYVRYNFPSQNRALFIGLRYK